MSMSVVYERDLLYPTESINEPGCIRVEMLNPNKKGYIPVVIESKTSHSPVKNIDSIIRTMQTDIFDRIHVDIKRNVNLYIKVNHEMKKEYGGKKYALLSYSREGSITFTGIDSIEE